MKEKKHYFIINTLGILLLILLTISCDPFIGILNSKTESKLIRYLYVANNNSITIHKNADDLAGDIFSWDSIISVGTIQNPKSVLVDNNNRLYVANSGNNTVNYL